MEFSMSLVKQVKQRVQTIVVLEILDPPEYDTPRTVEYVIDSYDRNLPEPPSTRRSPVG